MVRIILANNKARVLCVCVCVRASVQASVFFHFRMKVNNSDVKAISNFYFPNTVPEKHGWLQRKGHQEKLKEKKKRSVYRVWV